MRFQTFNRRPVAGWPGQALAAAAVAVAVGLASPAAARPCEDLSELNLPDTRIVSVETMPVGGSEALGTARSADLPAACRVIASIEAAPDSSIRVEIWLPISGWNGGFHGNGNGGFGGVLSSGYGAMATGLMRGYVTAVSDVGTAPATPLDGEPLTGHPRKWRDWGRLSTHVMTTTGKAVTEAYYGSSVSRAYYTGCSTGGQQGLIEALYYPDDYDGILVGAPVINRTWGHAAVLSSNLAAHLAPDSRLNEAQLALLHRAVLDRCGGMGSGLAGDGFLGDPGVCDFDPAALECTADDEESCLTPAQVETARAFYAGPTDANGRPLFYGWPRGSEAPGLYGWDFLQSRPGGRPPFVSLFDWVFGAGWDWSAFSPERDMQAVDAALGPIVNDATRGDLAAFRARGGKLIIYHGWEDALVPPAQTIAFYDDTIQKTGGVEPTQAFARLFLAPGVMHCGGGGGPNTFNSATDATRRPPSADADHDLFTALEQWVEQGAAPDRVIATRYVDNDRGRGVEIQRPLCAYPARAWYRGEGDPGEARNFTCSTRRPGDADR